MDPSLLLQHTLVRDGVLLLRAMLVQVRSSEGGRGGDNEGGGQVRTDVRENDGGRDRMETAA